MSTTSPDRRPIVVGFDGSDTSVVALDWALGEARRRGHPVHAIVAKSILYLSAPGFGVTGPWPDDLSGDLRETARARAAERAPGVVFSSEAALGSPASFLVAASRSADMVVVGRATHRMLGEAVGGSTSSQVVAHSTCPVIVVQDGDETPPRGAIVVGVDGSAANEDAVAFAFDRAAALGAPLVAVHAWWLDVPDRVGLSWLTDEHVQLVEQRHGAMFDQLLADWSAKYPDVSLRGVMTRELPVPAVARIGRGAQLVVVGGRGHGGFAGLLLGSVSQGLLHHERTCPLAVVHAHR